MKTLLLSPIHLNHHSSAVAPLLLCYRSAVALLSLRCCSVVAPLSHRYRTAIVPLSLRRCRSVVALLSHRYPSTVATQSHHYLIIIVPLSLRCCRSCCCYAVTPLSLHCRTIVEPLSLRPRENINNSKLNCCCSTVTPLSLLLSIGRFTRLSPQEA